LLPLGEARTGAIINYLTTVTIHRHLVVAVLGGIAIFAAGCGEGTKERGNTVALEENSPSAQAAEVVAGSNEIILGTEAPAPALGPNLPGVTVIGMGEARGKPDKAIVRFTIGPGNQFSGPEGVAVEPIEEQELAPVVEALKRAGAQAEGVTVNTYAASPYGGFGSAAQITLTWPHPDEIDKAVEAAQDVVRAKTQYTVQNVETLFTTSSCPSLEDRAWKAAIADAAKRATRLASLTGGGVVGHVVAVSEAGGVTSAFDSGLQGCQAFRSLPSPLIGPSLSEGSPDALNVRASLQVTFTFKSGT
jgi:uncharacterized protein YggE